jgi:AraC family transcriptional regulator
MLDAPNGLEYVTAVEAPSNAASTGDLTVTTLPVTKYAAFPHRGDVTTIHQTVDAAFSKWLPASGYEAAERPQFIERYGEKFDPETSSGDIEVWIPLKS